MSSSVRELRPGISTSTRANASDEGFELQQVGCYLTDSLLKRVLRLVFPDRRKHERLVVPPLVGYLGTAQSSAPYQLTDISLSGFCMLTEERWTPGTEMPVTLQKTSLPDADDGECFTVQATVVRCGGDGVGFSILLSEENSQAAHGNRLRVKWISKPELDAFLKRLKEPAKDRHAVAKHVVAHPGANSRPARVRSAPRFLSESSSR